MRLVSIDGKTRLIQPATDLDLTEKMQKFPYLAVEDEGRLRNPRIKEHFLTKLFTLESFRKTEDAGSHKSFVEFHSQNKLLLKAYNQK